MLRIYPPKAFVENYLLTHTRAELDTLAEANYKRGLIIEQNAPTYNNEANALILVEVA